MGETVAVSTRRIRGNSLNLPYPHSEEPQAVLPAYELFGDVTWDVDDWQAGLSVTIDWDSRRPRGGSSARSEPLFVDVRHQERDVQ